MFLEYKELIQRPRIYRELELETQALMSQIKSILQQQRIAMTAVKTNNQLSTPDVPETCREIYAVRQIETKVLTFYCQVLIAFYHLIQNCICDRSTILRKQRVYF